jgi:hypothetical protein
MLARLAETPQISGVNALPDLPVSDAPHPLQVKAWREMGGSGRSELGAELRRKARGWKRDALRAQHPDWPDERLDRELARIYLRGNT